MKKKNSPKILIEKNGPYVVSGNLPICKEVIVSDKNGYPYKYVKAGKLPRKEIYRLCRCGYTKDAPYCDNTHVKIGFKCRETATTEKYVKRAKKIVGPELVLTDAEDLCAVVRFCQRYAGVWNLTRASYIPRARKEAIRETWNCAAGRLVVWDKKTGKPIEPKLKPSISLIEDPDKNVSGPIWVKGGVPIESYDGTKYEVRNRVTLCRCGKSSNKPFCDGTHISAGFTDEDKIFKKKD